MKRPTKNIGGAERVSQDQCGIKKDKKYGQIVVPATCPTRSPGFRKEILEVYRERKDYKS